MKKIIEKNKFRDPWYRKLTPKQKCIWEFLVHECSGLKIVSVDAESVGFHVGESVSSKEIMFFSNVFVDKKVESQPKRRKAPVVVEKKECGESGNVLLTELEFRKLLLTYNGIHHLEKAIDVLDRWIGIEPKKLKKRKFDRDHYLTMKKNGWVYNKVFEGKLSKDEKTFENIIETDLRS